MRRLGVSGSLASMASMIGVIGALAGGCALDPVQPTRDPSARPPSPSDDVAAPASPTRPATTSNPTARPSSSSFSEYVATSCNGRPSAGQVVAVVRPKLGLAASVQVTVTMQPSCAGTWQYTVLSVPGHELIHVVTKGQPAALEVVAAGTNPCIPTVRVSAPAGIRTLLQCDAVTGTAQA